MENRMTCVRKLLYDEKYDLTLRLKERSFCFGAVRRVKENPEESVKLEWENIGFGHVTPETVGSEVLLPLKNSMKI